MIVNGVTERERANNYWRLRGGRREVSYDLFEPPKGSSYLPVIKALAKLHQEEQQPVKNTENSEVYLTKAYQRSLTELLQYARDLLERRLVNDFERLYVESVTAFYERGQEAVQKMILAGYSTADSCKVRPLIGNFLPENIVNTEAGVVFLNSLTDFQGFAVHDLTLFLKMYLPLQNWEVGLAQEILASYEDIAGLNIKEKQMLLAELSFPGRYCLYAEQYFSGAEDPLTLVTPLKNYFLEVDQQDYCLEQLGNWLWGE